VNDHFFIKDKHSLVKVNYADVLYAEACDNYSIIYTKQTKYILSYTLKVVEEKLSLFQFFRTHRSFLVNLKHIEKVNPKEVLVNGKEIPVSENSRARIIAEVEFVLGKSQFHYLIFYEYIYICLPIIYFGYLPNYSEITEGLCRV
jgi:DNA-binding LytR/AlgR family response regulator